MHKNARNYLKEIPFLHFEYYGQGLVIVADQSITPFIKQYVSPYQDQLYRVFDAPQINRLSKELETHNMVIAHIADYYLPDESFKPDLNTSIKVDILYGDQIIPLYKDKRFEMALCYKRDTKRRDEIAVVGYIDGQIAGVAGSSNDSETMWQIGIDVVKEFRNQNVAATLTYLLSKEILKKGKVPFYCTAYSNIASRRTAQKAGFKSAWVSLTAKKKSEEWIDNIIQGKEEQQ